MPADRTPTHSGSPDSEGAPVPAGVDVEFQTPSPQPSFVALNRGAHPGPGFGWVETITRAWQVGYFSTGPRRPRWKNRLLLAQSFVAPGMAWVPPENLSIGMKRLHLQRVRRARGWVIETMWGQKV